MHITFVNLIVDVFKTSFERLSLIVNARKKTSHEYLFAGFTIKFSNISDKYVFLVHIKEYSKDVSLSFSK